MSAEQTSQFDPDDYRPLTAQGADQLPEGFSSEVRVAALVVRDGTRMTPEMPMDGEDVKGWQVTRTFKQDHPSSEFADFPNDSKRITVESLTFDTQEEAIAAAKKMEKEPAELDRLYDAKFRSPSNTSERKEFLDNLITKNQQKIASRDWAEKSGRTPVEPSTYRPFVAQTPDVLPEGFAAQSWAKAVVVRDGTRILADKPQENDKVVGWAAGRSVYMDTRNNAYPDIKTLPVERFNFDTQEEALAAAQKMSREPISLEKLNTIKEVRDRSGGEWRDYRSASDLLDNMIAEKQQEQEKSKLDFPVGGTMSTQQTAKPHEDDAIHAQLIQNNNKFDAFAASMDAFNHQPAIREAMDRATKYGIDPKGAIHEALDKNPALMKSYLNLHKNFHEHIQPAMEKHMELIGQMQDTDMKNRAMKSLQGRMEHMADAQKHWPDRDNVMKSDAENKQGQQGKLGLGDIIVRFLAKLKEIITGKREPVEQAKQTGDLSGAAQKVGDVALGVVAPEVAVAKTVAQSVGQNTQNGPAQRPGMRRK